MRTSLVTLSTSLLAFAALGFALPGNEPPPQQRAPVVVTIDVRCQGNAAQYTVEPWEVVLSQGGRIEWRLTEETPANEFLVESKTEQWPFDGPPRVQGRRGAPSVTPNMRPDQRGRRYQYNIRLTCQSPAGPRPVLIDPDIVIRDE